MLSGSYTTTPFGHTLIVGAGPAAVHTAVHLAHGGWCSLLGLMNRRGPHTTQLAQELERSKFTLVSSVQTASTDPYRIQASITDWYEGCDRPDDLWDTLFLCTPSDAYNDVLRALQPDSLTRLKTIVLLSPGMGSNLLVQSLLGASKDRIDVISLSTYYAATKFEPGSFRAARTKAYKKRISIASDKPDSMAVRDVKRFVESLGVHCVVASRSIEAESRSITTYVHPPLFMNDFSLDEIWGSGISKKSMYKLYPEGPITPDAIRTMVRLWREISEWLRSLGAEPVNLLRFLNDDNYPVHEATLSRDEIDRFTEWEPVKQEYLLYVRYASILIDPFSVPDENGRYFDFSAVPYKQAYQDGNGKWMIPRIPLEDYKKLKLICGLAQKADIAMPQASALIERFEARLDAFVRDKGADRVHPELNADTTSADVEAVWREMRRGL
ncbi:opine metallophore biosynthesis dehydrogenase [Paenibacillus elgii]|uniref:opine metallophore biosynthesis dehydrogenase n=1 Tax=Paenibacillus elgii TaxID=189691 RepID=UPI000248CF6F|nr:opine metallophore biosynthesis dehydrogenase [Paenibacillus elgii]